MFASAVVAGHSGCECGSGVDEGGCDCGGGVISLGLLGKMGQLGSLRMAENI